MDSVPPPNIFSSMVSTLEQQQRSRGQGGHIENAALSSGRLIGDDISLREWEGVQPRRRSRNRSSNTN